MMSNIVLFSTVIGPVTPAMHKGWAPKTEKMKAAMNEERSTSATPYCCVVSMRSRENAIPGSTLHVSSGASFTCLNLGTHFAKNIRTMAGMTL